MSPYQLIAQAIGIVAMALNILSYQRKRQRDIILMQMGGAVLFTVNFIMLGATTGACLNFIAILRAAVYANKERFHAEKAFWCWLFSGIFVSVYVLSFAVFGKTPTTYNLIVEAIPVVAMIVTTISFRAKEAATVRKLALIGSPLWLIYNCLFFAVGGIICETVSIISAIVGMLRYDKKKVTQ